MALENYVNQELKGIKKSFDLASRESVLQMSKIPAFKVESTDEFTEIFTSTESLGGSKKLGERETPPVNKLNDGYEVSYSNERFGNSIEVTSMDREKMKDSTTKVDQYLIRQRNALLRDLKNKMAIDLNKFLNDAFDGTYLQAPDGVAIAGTHSWKTSGAATWSNATTSKFTESALNTALEAGSKFTDASGHLMPQLYDTIVVRTHSDNARLAKKLFAKDVTPTQYNDVSIYAGSMKVIETPWIDYDNRNFWFLMDLKTFESPFYMSFSKAPRMEAPITERNLSIISAVESFWKTGVINMPVNVYCGEGSA